MPRAKTTRTAEPEQTPNSIVAAATNLTRPQRTTKAVDAGKSWQEQAWYFNDTCGELAFGTSYVANAMSQVTLKVMKRVRGSDGKDDFEDVDAGPAVDALAELYGGPEGQSQMLAQFAAHLFLPGETYLIGEPAEDGGGDVWFVASPDEVRRNGKRYTVDRGDGPRRLADDALIIRIWRPHPRRYLEPTSSVRPAIPVLRQIESLNKRNASTFDSRLAGNGLLLLPSEMSFNSPATPDGDGTEKGSDDFFESFTDSILEPIDDPGSPAARVPVVVKAPGEVIGNAQYIRFDSDLDDETVPLSDLLIRRLALTLDLPVEVLLGQADSNHWSAWQIDEASIKVHIEPMLRLVTAALTEHFLWAVLDDDNVEDYVIVGDTTTLRLRPDHSADAVTLYNLGEIDGEALRRETGFEEADKPEEEELRRMLLLKIAREAATPEAAVAALKILGVDLTPAPAGPGPDDTLPAPRPRPVAVPDIPEPAPNPRTDRAIPQQAALLAACEPIVARAVERANNRLNRRGRTRKPIEADRCDEALTDAWTCVPSVADRLGVDHTTLTAALDKYTRAVLTEGVEPQPEVLARVLGAVGA